MTTLTKVQITTELRAGLGGRDDLDARFDTLLNLAQLRIARLKDFDELRVREIVDTSFTGVPADDKFLTLPTTHKIRRLYSLRLITGTGSSNKLTEILTKNWDKEIPEPQFWAPGKPEKYTRWGTSQIELWRVPDAVYPIEVRSSKFPQSVSLLGDQDTLDLENVDDAIIMLALSHAYLFLGREDKATKFFGIYSSMLNEAIGLEDEHFDLDMAGIRVGEASRSSGVDDPFVRSIDAF